MPAIECSVEGCTRAGKLRRTYCENHYRKFMRSGTTDMKPKPTHGTATMYRYGCRCTPCQAAHAERYREWAHTHFEQTGEWHSGRWINDRDRQAIYQRDAWTCQICRHPIDRDAKATSQWAPSLDHIEPRSTSLEPDHSAENLRTAHMWCNAVRGDARMSDGDIRVLREGLFQA
ncbi:MULTISPECIES: HNH endonuclease [Arthrobacter]|uniref:HNH endonuclease n=1 Tax=Arthrobacter terricola TaxID=2547396 RepID=A0A4R5K5C8_9MICC|nr:MULTISPECIES: hypothetical protein [Arthrobacter]MBT8163052.1 hypothetical protein [Arthrobacter sp. GN70]TDF88093.1 hypothetical protein E1809_24035 [Arthrobacter terricola]